MYCFILVAVGSALYGQDTEIDSLRKLADTKTGINKVDVLNVLSVRLILLDYNLAGEVIEKALQLAKESDYPSGQVEATVNKAICENIKGNTQQSLRFLRQALQTVSDEGSGSKGYAMTQLANFYRAQGAYDSARYWYEGARQLLEGRSFTWQLSVLYKNLGLYYGMINNTQLELDYLKRSLALRQQVRDKILLLDISLLLVQWYVREYDFVQAKIYLNAAEKYAAAYPASEPAQEIVYQKAQIGFRSNRYEEALTLFGQVKQFYVMHGNLRSYASLLVDMAEVLEEKGSYDLSLKNGFDALKIAEEKKFIVERARALLIIARNYMRLGQTLLSHEYNDQAISVSQTNGLVRLEGAGYNQRGLAFQIEGNKDEALKHYQKGYTLRELIDDKAGMMASLGNVGEIYEEMGLLDEALVMQNRSEQLAESISHHVGLFWVYYNKARIYWKKKDLAKVEFYLNKGEDQLKWVRYPLAHLYVFPIRIDLLTAKGSLKEALRQSQAYIKLKDSLNSSDITNRVLSLQSIYKMERKDLEIALLNKSKEVQDEKIKSQELQLRNREYIIGLVILALLLTGGLAFTSNRSSKKMSVLNRELQDRKEEIETQSEEITEANASLTKLNDALQQRQQEITTLNDGLEQKVRTRTAQLQQAYKELDTFFYRSSHDFRRPLTTFMGLAAVAKITIRDTSALDLFEKVNLTALNLDRMLIKFQSISDVGAQQFLYKEIYMDQVFENSLDSFRESILQRKIKVTIDVKPISSFSSYPAFLKIIVDNLIENSIQFSNTLHPFLHLSAEEQADHIMIRVEDNGVGIEEEYKNRIFEMFFRGNEHSTGNGLGLYIVKKAVDKLEGKIAWESTLNIGTVVTLWLPKKGRAVVKD